MNIGVIIGFGTGYFLFDKNGQKLAKTIFKKGEDILKSFEKKDEDKKNEDKKDEKEEVKE